MITPRFSCSQSTESVMVSIYCPSVRASDVEINVDETLVTVHINPYFLRLNFAHRLVEDDESSAQYDPGTGYLIVTLTKEVKGQEFPDLDLLAKLLAPRQSEPVSAPTIEVIETSDAPEEDTEELIRRTNGLTLEQEEILQAAENDWQLPQAVPEPLPPLHLTTTKFYGFLDMHSGYFTHVSHTENEVNELGTDVESCPVEERRTRRLKYEEEKWDAEYYMADFADDEHIQELLVWQHPYLTQDGDPVYTEAENMIMLRLPRKEYMPTADQQHNLYLTLISVLFSYAYDARTTLHDPTSESAWTICSLTPAFSALDAPPYWQAQDQPLSSGEAVFSTEEILSTLVQSYRRVLAFPLYRSFVLADSCRMDVAKVLSRGKRMALRCLLDLKKILDHHDIYYVYSKIWVDDLCVWIQTLGSDEILKGLAKTIEALRLPKSAVGWDLEELEAVVLQTAERDSDSDDDTGE
ncbi:hypothetical protein SERLA73DRAFT_113046 [Serpula lacrymans var. lacrymans S7.3]|uniref:CS domain-containing protein n=2 Tax=Serpula lacrymans var. lacrymans TaxID=341189 RepID=F8Q7E5_SERL3|nr:uncharacterized protein SERLADRAFT_417445 [Serpula lacrymans var. lacrymans S7.9]EGN95483.1 hypothetical protein SERLA73DRAFT_113046 [Serpula lacrymans var. lacrymans S7.3]EGO21010.1 hypothetical protein SERLADRAFT_417445 [Serpula lacrymans var. lacrymans S7.9]